MYFFKKKQNLNKNGVTKKDYITICKISTIKWKQRALNHL